MAAHNIPTITVIICTFNRASQLRLALDSLSRQTLDRSKYDVLVVDNNSSDNTKTVVNEFRSEFHVNYCIETTQGLSSARNRGIKEANTPYLAFIDDDAQADPQWLEKIVNSFSGLDKNVVAISGPISLKYFGVKPTWITPDMESFLGLYIKNNQKGILTTPELRGGNMAFRKDFLISIGGFSKTLGRVGGNLLSNDENYVNDKIKENNLFVYYDPDINITHSVLPARLHKTWFYKRYFWQGISDALFSAKKSGQKLKRLLRIMIMSKFFFILLLPASSPKRMENKCIIYWELGKLYYDLGFYNYL